MSAGKTRRLAELAVLTALTVAAKEVMAALPNVHPVALLLLLAVRVYGAGAFYVAFGFALLEIGLYGFGMWNIPYLYAWPALVAAALPLRPVRSRAAWAALAGLFGLSFGALCAIPYCFTGGLKGGFAYWVAGIPFDLMHCAGNAVLVFLLLEPLVKLVERLRGT